jgi:Flp pilus assembly protein TadD
MRGAVLPVALVAFLTGCATSGSAFRCEAKGGPAWRAVYSDHVVVVTDLDSDDAHALARDLDQVRAGVTVSLFQHKHDPPVRVTAIAFRSTAAYEAVAPKGYAAYYVRGAADPRIVLPGKLSMEQRRVLAHEMAHHVTAYVLLRQPRWLSEGLATWAETVGTTSGGIRMTTGKLPPGRRPLTRPQRLAARQLLAWDGSVPADGLAPYYDAAWLLVHYLLAQYPDALGAYEARLAGAEDPDEAFRAVFPQWDPAVPGATERLDAELDAWARNGRFDPRPVVVDSNPVLSEKPMEPAEVHAIRFLLRDANDPAVWQDPALRAELDEALVEDPYHPILLQLLARRDGVDPVPLARRSVQGRPSDPRAWSFLAENLPREDLAGREEALRRAVELAPGNPNALAALASVLVEAGRSGEALPIARQAVQRSPFSPDVLDTYATVAGDLGNCSQAVLASRRAMDVFPDDGKPEVRARLAEHLAGHLARCRPTP